MRFILLEGPEGNSEKPKGKGVEDFEVMGHPIDDPEGRSNLFKLTPELIREFETADNKRRDTILRQYLNSIKMTDFFDCYKKCCYALTLDEKMNPFITGLPVLIQSQGNSKNKIPYFNELINMVVSRVIPKDRIKGVGETYLVNKSLYFRNLKDFIYTVKVFEIIMDDSKRSKYLKENPTMEVVVGGKKTGKKIKLNKEQMIHSLYVKKPSNLASGEIKPAGSAADALKADGQGFNTETIFGTIEAWSKNNDAGGTGKGRKELDPKRTEVSKEVRDEAKKNTYYSFNEIPKERRTKGTVVYVKTPVSGDLSPEEFVNAHNPGFYQHDGENWVRLERYK